MAREGVTPREDAAWQVEKASLDSTRERCGMHHQMHRDGHCFIFDFIKTYTSVDVKICDINKMSQNFHNTFIFSCGGSQFNNLLFYFILKYKELVGANTIIMEIIQRETK